MYIASCSFGKDSVAKRFFTILHKNVVEVVVLSLENDKPTDDNHIDSSLRARVLSLDIPRVTFSASLDNMFATREEANQVLDIRKNGLTSADKVTVTFDIVNAINILRQYGNKDCQSVARQLQDAKDRLDSMEIITD